MSMQQSAPMVSWTTFAPNRSLKTPLGAASPLWAAYMAAAGVGVAFWWMTRWMRPINLETPLGREAEVKALAFQAPIAEPAPDVVEAAPALAVAEAEASEAEPVQLAPSVKPELLEAAPLEAASVEAAPAEATPAEAEPANLAPEGISPAAKALIARRKAAASPKASKPA